jgi:hypothetical protein
LQVRFLPRLPFQINQLGKLRMRGMASELSEFLGAAAPVGISFKSAVPQRFVVFEKEKARRQRRALIASGCRFSSGMPQLGLS